MSARSDWQNEQIERAQNVSTIAALRESLATKERELAEEKTLTIYLSRDIDILREQRDEWKARAEASIAAQEPTN